MSAIIDINEIKQYIPHRYPFLLVDRITELEIGKNLVEIILGNNGYRVVNLGIKVAPDVLVAAAKEHKPDLMTMDLTMPNKDGKTAIAEILQEYPDARIVVVSAVKGNTMLECMKLGARGYVEKPLKFAEAIFVEDFKRSIEEAL